MQGAVLGFIYEKAKKGLVYSRDIEKEFDMRRATYAGILRLLEEQKMIMRKPVNEDAGLKSITITDKAIKFQKEIEQNINASEAKLKENLYDKDIEIFMRIISQMSNNIK